MSNLYEPRYVGRTAMDVLEAEAAAPEIHGGAVGGALLSKAAAPALARPKEEGEFRADRGERDMVAVTSSVVPAAEAGERGELFEYRFSEPVTVRSGESAMLPFLQQKIGARKLLIYTAGGSQNPRNAAELTNTTGKTLDGGPITVFDGNAYAGEALVQTVKGGDKRLISYAVDLGTRITTRLDSARDLVREVHVRRGVLTARSALQETTAYTIRNVDQKPKTLIVEHAIRPEYKLIDAKATETTASAYRFEVKLAPGATSKLPVTEERVFDRTVALTNITPDVLLTYVQNKTLDAAARTQLETVAARKGLIAQNDLAIRRTDEQINEIVRDQDRLRQNISSLNRVSGQQDQVQKYAAQLASQETQLASLRDRQSELRKKKAGLEAELNRLIETMEF